MKASHDAHFGDKSGEAPKRRTTSKKGNVAKKKLKTQVTALQSQVDETSQLTEIAAVLKENSNTGTVSNTTVDENYISMVSKLMKIIGRKKKTASSCLSDKLPINQYVGRLAALIAAVETNPSSVIEPKSKLDNHTNMVVA